MTSGGLHKDRHSNFGYGDTEGPLSGWNQSSEESIMASQHRFRLLIRRSKFTAVFEATKTEVVCFTGGRIRERTTIPRACGNGHLLTPDTREPQKAPAPGSAQ